MITLEPNQLDKRFALVDSTGELRYPYKKRQLATGRFGYALGNDRHGGGEYVATLEEVIQKVVFQGLRVRVRVDPPIPGKNANGLSLHAKREVRGYLISDDLAYLVNGASEVPLGRPDDYRQGPTSPRVPAVYGTISARDLEFAVRTRCLLRPFNWARMAVHHQELKDQQRHLLFMRLEGQSSYEYVADILSIERRIGPGAYVELATVNKLFSRIEPTLFRQSTNATLVADTKSDLPCEFLGDADSLYGSSAPLFR